ncbi:MAG: hypothetical protein PHR06_02385 [Candidatus Cloacimonetes bacterium]|nr:hypothetical protein [Candidatus Cloacimonadota bacterium]
MSEATNFSIIPRAAKFFTEEGELKHEKANHFYRLAQQINCPMFLDDEHDIPLFLFSPRLSSMLDSDDYELDLWQFLTARENVIRMITATQMGRTAADSLSNILEISGIILVDIDKRMQFKQKTGYMIKVILEMFGYVVEQKRVKISENDNETARRFFSTASRYRRINDSDVDSLTNQDIKEPEKLMMQYIAESIMSGQTNYQKLYQVDRLTTVEDLLKQR